MTGGWGKGWGDNGEGRKEYEVGYGSRRAIHGFGRANRETQRVGLAVGKSRMRC